ncbi:hypothetical protein [Granulicella sp. L60]|jgi:hypothetical protein|uniref:hypothetical protein n=1 Tax=Granulicella sp. L60 TaxID=1641866 RepID=UPI00131E5895|nr:hypothetical protein [Granulicella sp. L60]
MPAMTLRGKGEYKPEAMLLMNKPLQGIAILGIYRDLTHDNQWFCEGRCMLELYQ